MRIFLDTNIVISALATRGLCADLYERILSEHEAVIGEPVVQEVIPAQTSAPALSINDKKDPWFIACTLQGDVDYFVTGDAVLSALGNAAEMPILSPRTCWDKLAWAN